MGYYGTVSEPGSPSRLLAKRLVHAALGLSASVCIPVVLPVSQEGRPQTWTHAACLAALRTFMAQYGRVPRHAEWREASRYGLPATATVRRVFGSVRLLVEEMYSASAD